MNEKNEAAKALTLSEKGKRAAKILAVLKTEYPAVKCELSYEKPHELLIATRLSAQCTDKRVNLVTPALFERFTSVEDFAAANVSEVEEMIKSCGLYKTKAAEIVSMCREIITRFDGKIPETIDELVTLPGVGRKTANLMVGELFGKPAVVADTHVIRLSNRLGLAEGKDAAKVEKALRAILPEEESLGFCHRLVRHGRTVCFARKPYCSECAINKLCGFSDTEKDK